MIDSYKKVIAGTTPRYFLPDLRDVILDAALPDLTFQVKAGLDGHGILVQACQQCHNPGIDPMLSKASFDVSKLATMAAAEKQRAMTRLSLPVDNILHMPPTRFRTLSAAEIGLATAALSK